MAIRMAADRTPRPKAERAEKGSRCPPRSSDRRPQATTRRNILWHVANSEAATCSTELLQKTPSALGRAYEESRNPQSQ